MLAQIDMTGQNWKADSFIQLPNKNTLVSLCADLRAA